MLYCFEYIATRAAVWGILTDTESRHTAQSLLTLLALDLTLDQRSRTSRNQEYVDSKHNLVDVDFISPNMVDRYRNKRA
jgi:hypothetical protein